MNFYRKDQTTSKSESHITIGQSVQNIGPYFKLRETKTSACSGWFTSAYLHEIMIVC